MIHIITAWPRKFYYRTVRYEEDSHFWFEYPRTYYDSALWYACRTLHAGSGSGGTIGFRSPLRYGTTVFITNPQS